MPGGLRWPRPRRTALAAPTPAGCPRLRRPDARGTALSRVSAPPAAAP